MSNIKPDDLRRQAAEEEFFRLAALEIESEQNEEFLEAQSLPDPSPEVLQQMQANLQQTMRKTQKRKRHRTIFLNLKRLSACAAIVCCLLISGTYFSVDAARNSINNFVLELFEDHAVIQTDNSKNNMGALLPTTWKGPFVVSWVPSRFTNVSTINLQSYWSLVYSTDSSSNSFSIYVWDSSSTPHINTENFQLISQEEIQNTSANIYVSTDGKTHMLLWAVPNYTVQLGGNVTYEEILKIAKNMIF